VKRVTRAVRLLDLGDRGQRVELRSKAVAFLENVIKNSKPGGRGVAAAVSAARSVLEEVRWHDERDMSPERVMAELLGSEEKFLEWIEDIGPKVRARVEARRTGTALLAPAEEVNRG
jgi:hypothetical protein